MVPPPDALHVTAVFVVPETAAVNCWVCVGNSVLLPGDTLTLIPLPPPWLLPQEGRISSRPATSRSELTTANRLRARCWRESPPNTKPVAGTQANQGASGLLSDV